MNKTNGKATMAGLLLVLVFLAHMHVDSFAASLKPTEAYYVNDFANVLEQDAEDLIIGANVSLEGQAGAQVVVVTVDFTDGKPVSDYAYDLFNSWGIGSKGKDNGVLLLLSIGDDDYYAMAGTGLEQGLSPQTLDDLLFRYLEPDFAGKNYNEGTKKIFGAIIAQLESYYGISVNSSDAQQPINAAPPNTQNSVSSQPAQAVRQSGFSLFTGILAFFERLLILIIVIALLAVIFGRARRVYRPARPRSVFFPRLFGGYRRPPRGGGWFGGGRFGGAPPMGRPPMEPPMPSSGRSMPGSGRPPSPGGMFSGGGGKTRGSGAGRDTSASRKPSGRSMFGGGNISGNMFGGGSKPSGNMFGGGSRPSGGMRTGGGGSTRGSGAGRRK